MALKIVPPSATILTERLFITLFGQPGIGKSSLGYSTNKPLLLDFDGGAQRAFGRKDTVRITDWSQIASITKSDVAEYETIVIDTVGRALEYLSASLIAGNPKLKRSTGELSMQGYGALKTAYAAWMGNLRTLNKDIVLIAHEKEDRNGDDVIVRIDAAGSTRTEVVRLSDLVGFVYADGTNRLLDFNPTSSHTGKNCAGFDPLHIPHLAKEPDWFGTILSEAKDRMNSLSAEQQAVEEEFTEVVAIIEDAKSAKGINDALKLVAGKPYEKQAKAVIHSRAKVLGLKADAKAKCYVKEEAKAKVEEAEEASADE